MAFKPGGAFGVIGDRLGFVVQRSVDFHNQAAVMMSEVGDVAADRRTESSYLLDYACNAALRQQQPVPHLQAVQQRLRAHLSARGLPTT